MSAPMKRCHDCTFFRQAGFDACCRALLVEVTETSPIDGKTRTFLRGNEEHADLMRLAPGDKPFVGKNTGKCGPEARLFEQRKLSALERLGEWLSAKIAGALS